MDRKDIGNMMILLSIFVLLICLTITLSVSDVASEIRKLRQPPRQVWINKTAEIDRQRQQITLLNYNDYVASCPLGKTNYESASALFTTGAPDTTKVPNDTWSVEDPELVFGSEDTYIVQVNQAFLTKIKNWAQGRKVTIIFR